MGVRARAIGCLAVAAAPLLLIAGCDGSTGSGASPTLKPIQATSFVTLLPATTTTSTTLPPGTESGGSTEQFSSVEQMYVIQPNDSVFRIASIHGIDALALAQYNRWPDGIDHLLVPGQTVLIPPDAQVPQVGTTVPPGIDPEADEPDTNSCLYTIVAGDNPSRVASRFDITVADLQGANPESVMNSFLVGAQLVIPGVDDCG